MRILETVRATGGPLGLPVVLLAALAAGACGEEPVPDEFASGSGMLWEVPPLPLPQALDVNGRPTDPVVLEGFLSGLWMEHWSQREQAGQQASAEEFYAVPRELFTPLVRGLLLLHEAEARWPDLDEEEAGRLRAEMAAGAGGAYEALLARIGEDGMRAHVARELRKRKLLAAFAELAEPLTDEEVFRRYDEMMSGVEDRGLLAERGVDFAKLEPGLRQALAREYALRLQEAWIDGVLPAAKVRLVLPDGAEIAW